MDSHGQPMLANLAIQVLMMALTGIAGWLGGKLKGAARARAEERERSDSERDSNRAVLRLLLFYRLKDLFDQYVVRGDSITAADKHEVEELYEHYHTDLGGNGEGTRMFKAIIDLKTE